MNVLRSFYDSIREQPEKSASTDIKSANDIAESVKVSHSVRLPPSIISTLDAGFASNKLKPNTTHDLVCSSIDYVKSQGFSWKNNNNPAGIHASFVRDLDKLSEGDILIRVKNSNNVNSFDAFKVDNSNSARFLGSEQSFEAIKSRVEQYVICLYVRDKVNEALTLAKSADIQKVQEKRADYGLEM